MLRELTSQAVPPWLDAVDSPDSAIPLNDLLEGSLYYAASGRDGDPIRYLGGFVHSFVYVDYGVGIPDVMESLAHPARGFRGYRIILRRELSREALVPSGWEPVRPNRADGDPGRYRSFMKTPGALWCVLERDDDHGEHHGPRRFSLLYLCGDGVATFQALYHGNKTAPKVVAIIQPGTGFGGNWTDFCDPTRIFHRSVMGNPHGMPTHLLYGGWGRDYRPCCWPADFPSEIAFWIAAGGELGLWGRRPGLVGRDANTP